MYSFVFCWGGKNVIIGPLCYEIRQADVIVAHTSDFNSYSWQFNYRENNLTSKQQCINSMFYFISHYVRQSYLAADAMCVLWIKAPSVPLSSGILYINPGDLGWNPLVSSWIDSREEQSEKANLTILFDKYLPSCLGAMRMRWEIFLIAFISRKWQHYMGREGARVGVLDCKQTASKHLDSCCI